MDLNTGAVAVAVPLLEVQSGALRLSVALRYSTTGVKVSQVPSWVGQGWNLAASGVITRTVRGQPDETPNVGYQAVWPRWHRADSLAGLVRERQAERLHKTERMAYDQHWDLEADTYQVSAPGLSATLACDAAGRCRLSPDQGWRVLAGGPTGGWVLAAPDGTHYRFDQEETSRTEDAEGIAHEFMAAWHLTAIESADGHDRIALEYLSDGPAIQVSLPQVYQVKFFLYGDPGTGCTGCLKDPPGTGVPGQSYRAVMAVWLQTVTLSEIRSATQRVLFTSDVLQQATQPGQFPTEPPARILRRIQVLPVHGDSPQARAFRFAYRYDSRSADPPDSVTMAGRYFLSAAQEVGQPATRFAYDDGASLPDIHSFAQDHWGYYNAAPNATLVPRLPFVWRRQLPGGANRATNPAGQQAGSLRAITYPTGGSIFFTYEANQALALAQFDVDEPTLGEHRLTYRAVANGSTYLDSLSQHAYDVLYGGFSLQRGEKLP